MLLKEFNQGGVPDQTQGSEPPSTLASPIKPLNCTPLLKDAEHFAQKKDFNSSSDTYVSENEAVEINNAPEPHMDSFTRNFEPDSSADLSKNVTEQQPSVSNDDVTHNDESDIEHKEFNESSSGEEENQINKSSEHSEKMDRAASPSKSIMKSHNLDSASPKKNVAFLAGPDLQTYHQYLGEEEEESFNSKKADAPAMVHLWTGLNQNSFDDNEAETTQPPLPPPHSSHTVTGLLTDFAADSANRDEPDISQLTEYRLTHKNFSNLSLNEKIDVFLNNKPHDDLNEHLDSLGKAAGEETDVNIHRLSYQLATHEPSSQENPLNALSHGLEYRLNLSARSSQSSLQSLMDSNKYLESNHIEKHSKGLQLNDGIKGFSDKLATEIIPTTLESAESSRDPLAFEPSFTSKVNTGDNLCSASADLSSQANQSQTEKSILNLLESVSQININEFDANAPQSKPLPEAPVQEDEAQGTQEEQSHEEQKQETIARDATAVKEELPIEEEKFDFAEAEENDSKGAFTVKKELDLGSEMKISNEFGKEIESCTPAVKIEPQEICVKTEQQEFSVKAKPEDPIVKSEPNDSVKLEVQDEVKSETECVSVKQELKEQVASESALNEAQISDPQNERLQELEFLPKADSASDALPMSNVADPNFDAITVQVDKAISAGQVKLVGPVLSQTGTPVMDSTDWSKGFGATDNGNFADESGEGARETLVTHHHTQLSSPAKILPSSRSITKSNIIQDKKQETVTSESVTHALTSSDYDSSVLANSSNIQPPFNIKLPVVELGDTDFDDLNKKLNEKSLSYEESLSAEHDAEKKSLDFLSIWHSQHLTQKSKTRVPPKKMYQVPFILLYNTADLSQCAKFHVPQSLKPKKFQEVNLLSTKVVSLSYENLYDSGFLPELSQDSGIEDHFEVFLKEASLEDEGGDQKHSLKRKNSQSSEVLVLESLVARRLLYRHSQPISYSTLKPRYLHSGKSSGAKKSKFAVPSFEIKRSSSILSPKNMYNDIFSDGSFIEPTIKAQGMKTLPSMDKDKIRKIMNMKDAISQTGSSQLKVVGKTATPETKHPNEQSVPLEASIHCDSIVSDPKERPCDAVPLVISEIITQPVAIKSSERVFEPSAPAPELGDAPQLEALSTRAPVRESLDSQRNFVAVRDRYNSNNPFLSKATDSPIFPDPDPELVCAPQFTPVAGLKISKQRKKDNVASVDETPVTSPPIEGKFDKGNPKKQGNRSSRGSPIKISSPVKLVKNGGSVTGVVLDKQIPVFNGQDIKNTVPNLRPGQKKNGHTLSTVSVPTIPTADCLLTTAVEIMALNNVSALSSTQPLNTIVKSRQTSSVSTTQVGEKGKLFLRVMGLKNVDLPDFKDREMSFNITLDNGVHCVKTPVYNTEGSASIPIGKEFELTVTNSLQFILTLKATYEKPRGTLVEVKERRVVQSRKKLGRLFGSKEVITTTRFVPKEAEDSWKNLFANDGLFARCYVDLEQYLDQVTGAARNFNLTCFNEWATIGDGSLLKLRAPYSIAQLEVKMLYVPRTEAYEILPISIKSAYECLDDLRKEGLSELEGYLHQEGGDCDSWKKRWFKLKGTSLIAHSEYSHKTRAKINLTKVAEVVYIDKENINRSSSNYRNFSDILLMEHAFKIRFADGEIIDFGAPNKEEKNLWIQAIQEIVYRNKFRRLPWVHMMMEKNVPNRRIL